MTIFKFRPHHLICNLCFVGKGYNEEFVQNLKDINQKLCINSSAKVQIEIVRGCDDICAKCPGKHGNFCSDELKVKQIDDAYLNILQLQIGQTIDFEGLKAKVKEMLTMDGFHQACSECSWYSLNICAPIIQRLRGC